MIKYCNMVVLKDIDKSHAERVMQVAELKSLYRAIELKKSNITDGYYDLWVDLSIDHMDYLLGYFLGVYQITISRARVA